jgi:hypothetical protein
MSPKLATKPLLYSSASSRNLLRTNRLLSFATPHAPINIDEFPSTKENFDVLFSTSTNHTKLSCCFEIRSARKSFHSIKIGVWDILQQFKIWFKKSPGPIKRTPLMTLGFWVNIHPGFSNPRSVIEELKQDLADRYSNHPAVIKQHALPAEFHPPHMYLARGRVSGQYHSTTSGKAPTAQPIDANTLLMYTSADDFECTLILLTKISTLHTPLCDQAPMSIPSALKKANPQKFGQYISQQNTFMAKHRNIAVVGVTYELMDLENESGTSLWQAIRALIGVYRWELCARTPDLGKWNTSSALTYNEELKNWLTEHLPKYFNAAPSTFPKLTISPRPEILSPNRRGRPLSLSPPALPTHPRWTTTCAHWKPTLSLMPRLLWSPGILGYPPLRWRTSITLSTWTTLRPIQMAKPPIPLEPPLPNPPSLPAVQTLPPPLAP